MPNKDQTQENPLTPEEQVLLSEGQALYEMTQSLGFKTLRRQLENLAFHSWVDPRETGSKEEWVWQEMNAFHAANNAKEILEWIQKTINDAEYLNKVKNGEVKRNQAMTI